MMRPVDGGQSSPCQLGLGTVQFGIDYGVTNKNGVPSDATVVKILSDALKNKIGIIDTAPAYGNAEWRLGNLLPDNRDCQIVTKTAVRPKLNRFGRDDAELVHRAFLDSLQRLQRDHVYGLLVHLGTDLLLQGGERLVETLFALRAAGLVKKVGVSIYNAEELDRILEVFTPEFVQLPLSIADQRLLKSGHLAKLKRLGVEIHVRSVFLQGVLLAEPATLPDFLRTSTPQFERIRTAVIGAFLNVKINFF